MSEYRAHAWKEAFNKKSLKIAYHEEIVDALFVVKVITPNLEEGKAHFLASSLLNANALYASMNVYNAIFKPRNPLDFCHLVTITIKRGRPLIFYHLRAIVSKVGHLVHPYII